MKPSSEIKDSVRSIRARNGKTSPPKSIYIKPDDLKRSPAAPEADVDQSSVGRGPRWPPRVLSRDLSLEHSVDALGKAPATAEIRYLATFWDQAKQIVSW